MPSPTHRRTDQALLIHSMLSTSFTSNQPHGTNALSYCTHAYSILSPRVLAIGSPIGGFVTYLMVKTRPSRRVIFVARALNARCQIILLRGSFQSPLTSCVIDPRTCILPPTIHLWDTVPHQASNC